MYKGRTVLSQTSRLCHTEYGRCHDNFVVTLVTTTTSGATSDDNVGIMTILRFSCIFGPRHTPYHSSRWTVDAPPRPGAVPGPESLQACRMATSIPLLRTRPPWPPRTDSPTAPPPRTESRYWLRTWTLLAPGWLYATETELSCWWHCHHWLHKRLT